MSAHPDVKSIEEFFRQSPEYQGAAGSNNNEAHQEFGLKLRIERRARSATPVHA